MADDYGVTPGTAGTLALGVTVSGVHETARDQDWFAIDLAMGTTYTFELFASIARGGGYAAAPFPVLILRDANGDTVRRANLYAPEGDPLMTHTALASGTYYLDVRDGSDKGATGNYLLRASLAEYPPNFIGGTAGNDVLMATPKDDIIVSGAGIDTVVFPGSISDYQLIGNARGEPIAVTRGVSDHLFQVERLRFDDAGKAYDFDGNGGKVARSINVMHGHSAPARDYVVKGLALLDQGMSFTDYMQQNLDAFLGVDASSEEIVSFLYTNVARREPPPQAMEFYTGLLDDGIWTPGELAVYAADHANNLGTVDYTGWLRYGMAYWIE